MTQHLAATDLKLIDTTPRVMDLTLAHALDLNDPHKIRNLIKRNAPELARYGEVSAMVAETSAAGGRPSIAYWLNEPQSVLVCMFSEGPRAADVRQEIIRVFMDWRAQQAQAPKPAPDVLAEFPAADGPLAEHMAKLATLRECRMIHGPRAAARLWKRLGMPQVAESTIEERDEGRRCLAHLLDTTAVEDADFGDHLTVRMMIEAALSGDTEAALGLRERFHLLAIDGPEEGLFVPNAAMHVARLFAGTPWAKGRHIAALRRLPGSTAMRKTIGVQHRGTFIPSAVIDTMPMPVRAEGDNVVSLR